MINLNNNWGEHMKLNKKGFLLAETIVTVCIIATLATSMYLYISRTVSRFEDRDNYENVVDVYKTNTLKKYLTEKNFFKDENATGKEISNIITDPSLTTLKSTLGIEASYLILNKETEKSKIDTSNQALKDYINWISIDGSESDFRLIVWFKNDGSDGTFANIKVTK